MTLSAFQKGQIDKFMETHSEALFKALCEKHKVDMNNLDSADVFNLVGEVREINENVAAGTYNKSKESPSSETKQAATTTAKVLQEPKPTTQRTFTRPESKEQNDDEDEQKTIDDRLEDLRGSYPDCVFDIRFTIEKDTAELCQIRCNLTISKYDRVGENLTLLKVGDYESFGYSTKADEGTRQLKKYMIPLSETRAVKRACRLATVGVKPREGI